MLWRIATFLACELAGAFAGAFLGRLQGGLIGAIVGGLVWFAVDLSRGVRLVRWLRAGSQQGTPPGHGLWGEAAERIRRSLRSRDQLVVQAEQRLQDFLAAIQASPNGVVLLDAQGRIEWSNQTAGENLGIDPRRDLQQLIGNLLRDPAFSAYYNSGKYAQGVVIPGPGSTPSRPVRIAVHLHPYGEGRKLLLSQDITGIEQAEVMRRDFVANVSHEIRTPLTVLTGFVETLQSLPLGEDERARYLGLMAQQAHRMQTLVNDLLTLSRLEGSPLPGAYEWTPLALLAVQTEEDARGLMGVLGKTQALRFEPPPPFEISGAMPELLSALTNLVSNAVRYTPSGGSVDVTWRELEDGRLSFTVADTGPGIAPEHISRLTERFYRVDRSRSRETGGTGLGLAIVKHVVQRHAAELKIESTPGLGSRFSIVFPASRLRSAVKLPADAPIATAPAAG